MAQLTARLNPFSEGARPQLVLPQRGVDRQALPALTSDSARDPGKPLHKPTAERLALFLKTAEQKRRWILCRGPERQAVLSRSPPGQHLQQLKWIAARDYQTIAHLKMSQRGNDSFSTLKEMLLHQVGKSGMGWPRNQ
jgi:hypothetical protein